jgi:hypothetical protein
MAALVYTLVGLFAVLCAVGAGALIWAVFFSIRMAFQIEQQRVALSRVTMWNPMNAIVRPELLSEAGRRSRRCVLGGLLVFGVAYMCAGAFALSVKLMGKAL